MMAGITRGVELKDTGHATMLDRVKAARKMLDAMAKLPLGDDEWAGLVGKRSAGFLSEMWETFEDWDNLDLVERSTPSVRQYFWIKDLYDKSVLEE